jgi:Mg2+/Co2+ transporter CorB
MLDDSPSSLTAYIIFFVICLFCRAVFSFLETSIAALRLFKLKEMAASASEHYNTLFQSLEKHPHRVLITILISSNLADVILSAIPPILPK